VGRAITPYLPMQVKEWAANAGWLDAATGSFTPRPVSKEEAGGSAGAPASGGTGWVVSGVSRVRLAPAGWPDKQV